MSLDIDYQNFGYSIIQYHSNVKLGLVPERSYSSWGPECDEERWYRERGEKMQVRLEFRKINWNLHGDARRKARRRGRLGERRIKGVEELCQGPILKTVQHGDVAKVRAKKKAANGKFGSGTGKRRRRKLSEGSRAWR